MSVAGGEQIHPTHRLPIAMKVFSAALFTIQIVISVCTPLSRPSPLTTPVLTPTTLSVTFHASSWSNHERWNKGPCEPTDTRCMNYLAVKYINILRKRYKIPLVEIGTRSMLDNALRHSRAMAKHGGLFHQKAPIKICNHIMAGENISLNHVFKSDKKEPTDPVKLCFEQFWGSEPHRNNMLASKATHFAMGVYIAEDGYIWCTQTYWKDVVYGKGKCAKA